MKLAFMEGNYVQLYQLFRNSLTVIFVDLNLQLLGGGENANHKKGKAQGVPDPILGTIILINVVIILHLNLDI